jgi:hypothetical protein
VNRLVANFLRRPHGATAVAADVVRVLGAVGILVAALWWAPTDAGVVAFALPALLVPRFLAAPAGFDLAFGVALTVATWSNVLDLYRTLPGWDLLVHFVCSALITALIVHVLAGARVVAAPGSSAFTWPAAFVLCTVIALASGALWEFVEWFGYTVISDDIFVSYQDTIGDLAADAAGGIAAAAGVKRVGPVGRPSNAS